MSTATASHHHLILFGRYPVPGRVKTRLIPALGAAGAANLQRHLTEQTVAAARATSARVIFCHGGGDRPRLERWLGRGRVHYLTQTGGDLGRRMGSAIRVAFAQGARRVVLVGTDLPDLTPQTLERAFAVLASVDLVIGPSTDGGYWLVGMNRPMDLFRDITWSRSDVLEKTLALARGQGLRVHLLAPMTDLDLPADVARFRGVLPPLAPYLSVIIPALNEERRIASAIASATSPDAQLIVSDGGSCDRTVAIALAHGARVVTGSPGRAVQQNRGAAAAHGAVLLFLHADTRLPADYVTHVFETLMDRRTVLGAFRFRTDLSTPAMRAVAFLTNRRASWLQLPYGDQGLFVRRADFWRVGGFPRTPIAEDLLLVRLLARRGRIALAPAVAVTSGRRWQRIGVLRTTLINAIIATGCLAGLAPARLASLYTRSDRRAIHE